MKKNSVYFIVIVFFFLFFSSTALGKEKSPIPYFGINAEVLQIDTGTYVVNTSGKKPHEGFVFTVEPDNNQLNLSIDLKGKKPVVIKMEETDSRGTFIKETLSETISLSEDWKSVTLHLPLQKNTAQVDIMVLTEEPIKTSFSFRDIHIEYK